MKILVVTNMYPDDNAPVYGIFVEEQVKAIKAADPTISMDVFFINGATEGKLAYLKSINRVLDHIESGCYDIVHVHYGLSGLFLLHPFRHCHIPVLATLHGGDIQPEGRKFVQIALTRRILHHADRVIALNKRMANLASRDIPLSQIDIIPCAVNTYLFIPPEYPRRQLKGLRRLTVIFPSEHSRIVKNYPLFCRVVDELYSRHRISVDEIELSGMSRTEVAMAMASADLLLMTSKGEGSPQVVKEALACNLPVISTPVGDVETLLEGVDSCAVVPPEAKAMADSIVSLTRGELHTNISERDRIFALGLDASSVAQRIINLYKLLANK